MCLAAGRLRSTVRSKHSTVSSLYQSLPTLVLGPHVASKPLQQPEARGQMRTAPGNHSPFHFLQQTLIELNYCIISALIIGKFNNISPERQRKNVVQILQKITSVDILVLLYSTDFIFLFMYISIRLYTSATYVVQCGRFKGFLRFYYTGISI